MIDYLPLSSSLLKTFSFGSVRSFPSVFSNCRFSTVPAVVVVGLHMWKMPILSLTQVDIDLLNTKTVAALESAGMHVPTRAIRPMHSVSLYIGLPVHGSRDSSSDLHPT